MIEWSVGTDVVVVEFAPELFSDPHAAAITAAANGAVLP
jgi:hypothetical protein